MFASLSCVKFVTCPQHWRLAMQCSSQLTSMLGQRRASESSSAAKSTPSTEKVDETPEKIKAAIGIDLGTTNSCVAVMEGRDTHVIENEEGDRTTPSVVAFRPSGECIVGKSAKRQAVTNRDTFYATKRLIGRRIDDAALREDLKHLSYEVTPGINGDAWVRTSTGEAYSPAQIGAFVLRKLKGTAEAYLNETVKHAVVTVPAYFNDAQRQATKDAAKIAGLEVLRVINEPTAAALAYGLDKRSDRNIAVYDFGGGTFDVSILSIKGKVFEVRATNGDTILGGEDFDHVIVQYLLTEFEKEFGVDLKEDHTAMQRIREAAEKAKCELSSMLETTINIGFLHSDEKGPKHLIRRLTRAEFEKLFAPILERTQGPCRRALLDAKLHTSEIAEVLLVGGSTRIPKVQEMAQEIFDKMPSHSINPDEAVAIGAAIQAGISVGKIADVHLLDVTPLSLGVETLGGVFTRLILRNTTIPTCKSRIFSTVVDNQEQVDIKVYQGERELASDNKLLASFHLVGISLAPRGIPQIEVEFDIDANGIVHVTGKDMGTGRKQDIVITEAGGLSKAEIESMLARAEEFAAFDAKKRRQIELVNIGQNVILEARSKLKAHGCHLNVEETVSFNNEIKLVDQLLEAKDNVDNDHMQKKIHNLKQMTRELSELANLKLVASKKGAASPTSLEEKKKAAEMGAQKMDTAKNKA